MDWMRAVFYGVGPAVIAIIGRAAVRLSRMTNARDRLLWGVTAVMGAITVWTGREIATLCVVAGMVVLLLEAPPPWLRAALVGHGVIPMVAPWALFWFFAQAGSLVFGSGLAIVPFLHGELVESRHWLTERQFLDAVAVAMITPGPIVITVAFIGYLLAGPGGAAVAALGVFLPVYLFVVGPYPWLDRWSENPQVRAFVRGVTAAATGALAGSCIVLGHRVVVDIPTAALAGLALLILVRFKLPEPVLIAAAAGIGLVFAPLVGR
jgi:chromate transporter